MIGIERGEITDLSKRARINIAALAAREVEDMDFDVAQRLYVLDAKVAKSVRESGG